MANLKQLSEHVPAGKALLNRAADMIAENGHSVGVATKQSGEMCALSAIRHAFHEDPLETRNTVTVLVAWKLLYRQIKMPAGDLMEMLFKWNDSNSAETVINTMKEAAA